MTVLDENNADLFAIFCKLRSADGQEVTQLVFATQGESKDDVLWRIHKKCAEFFGLNGVEVDLVDHQVIYTPRKQ